MAEQNINFSKIVSTPSPTAWSQAYSAGKLFAALSLSVETVPQEGLEYLAGIGKEVISTLESEFFTLEEKNLESIKVAVSAALGRIGVELESSLILCYFSENVLYLFAQGGGKAAIRRGDKIGTVLESDASGGELKTSSGYVKDSDIIVLETKPFQDIVSQSTLAAALEKNDPEIIAEELSPQVHEKAEGGASSVVIKYVPAQFAEDAVPPLVETNDQPEEEAAATPEAAEEAPSESEEEAQVIGLENLGEDVVTAPPAPAPETPEPPLGVSEINTPPFAAAGIETQKKRRFSLPSLSFLGRLPRGRRTAVAIAGILIILLLIISVLALVNRGGGANKKAFEEVYNSAKGKYDEGQNLKDLNADLAQNDFKEAKQIIEQNQSKFPEGSTEGKQLSALLTKVNSQITSSSGTSSQATEVKATDSKLLSTEIDNPNANYFTQSDKFIYFLDGSGISQIDKGNDKKTVIAKKTWKTEGGIGTFGSNVYVLDKSDGIDKFVPGSDNTYSSTDYFTGDTPSLAASVAMGIDGSIYVLNKDGSIDKYTKGKSDTFDVSGLDTKLSKATKIYTNGDSTSIYVLDNGNGRIVVLDKDGNFKTSYSAAQIKTAKDMDVDETNKKIFILSGGKVYSISIK